MEVNRLIGGNRGFSLVEVTVALVIGSIGLLALAGILTYAMQSNRRATDISIATALARQKIEQIKLTEFNYVVDETETDLNENGVDVPGETGKFTRVTEITDDAYGANTKLVDVTVYFSPSEMDTLKQAVVSTIIYP